MTMTDIDIEPREEVVAGARELDRWFYTVGVYTGTPWWRYINLDLLDMNRPDSCVIGQLHEHGLLHEYSDSGLNDWDFELGFNTRHVDDDYESLTDEWVALIEMAEALS